MATEIVFANFVSGPTTGVITDIDEGVAAADGNLCATSSNGEGDIFTIGFADVVGITDADIVNSIIVRLRCGVTGPNGTYAVDFRIGSVIQGTQQNTGALTVAQANYNLADAAGWDADYTEAQLNGMDVLLDPSQSGMPDPQTWSVDAIEIEIDYTAGSSTTPITGSSNSVFTPTSGIKGIGVLAAAIAVVVTLIGGITGIGVLTGTSAGTFTPSSSLTGIGLLAGSSSVTFTSTSTLTAAASNAISGSGTIIYTNIATLAGIGVLSGISANTFTPASNIKGIGVLNGLISNTFTPTANLTGIGVLSGSASSTFTNTSILIDAPRFILSPSANIAASGEDTTAQLTAPSGKTTGDFIAGRIQDDENPADIIDIPADKYTEIEWSIEATDVVKSGEVYSFRITDNGTELDSYIETPQWTIGGGTTAITGSSTV